MKNQILNEMLALTLQELEKNPEQFLESMKDNLPELEVVDGYAYIDVPAYENGKYGTRKEKIPYGPDTILKPGDDGYDDKSWDPMQRVPEGWTMENTGNGPSLEGFMIEMMGLPKRPTKRPKPQGF